MKLSIITPVYKEPKSLKRLLGKLIAQTSNKFEVILVVDTNNGDILSIVDDYEKQFKGRLKLIFNTKRMGRSNALYAGFKNALGTYSIILNSTNKFSPTLVEDILSSLEGKTADIVEFRASFKAPLKFLGTLRKQFKEKTIIADHPEIIAYSYFFDFNKLYKTSLLKKVADIPPLITLNSRFSTEISYKALLLAKTYQTHDATLVSSHSSLSTNYNPLKLIRQFNAIIKWAKISNFCFEQELEYAKYIYISLFLFAVTGASKNKVLLKKLEELYKKYMNDSYHAFMESNTYILAKTKEAKLLHENYSMSSPTKLYKELK